MYAPRFSKETDMREITLIALFVATMGACRSQVDTDTDQDSDTASETDTDSCPGAIGQEEYIDAVLPEICEWFLTCPDNQHETVDDCVRVFSRYFNSQPCWNECKAAECESWLQNPPTCMDSREDTLQACNEIKPCPD